LRDLQTGHGLVKKIRGEIFRHFGSCLAPHNAWLHLLGLETLELRMQRMSATAQSVAEQLGAIAGVVRVDYPGLPGHRDFARLQQLMAGNGGSLLTFDLPSRELCWKAIDRVRMIRRATNVCDSKSLIIHPASTIYGEWSREACEAAGVRDTAIRLSVGLEPAEELLADLRQAIVG